MIPFFVVDRPISLDIVKGYWSFQTTVAYGLLSNALTTQRFRKLLARYPCADGGRCLTCGISEAPAEMCDVGIELRSHVTVFGDSGIFAGKARLTYETLYNRYDEMNADYGAVVDFLADPTRTVASAVAAVEIYNQMQPRFKLVLVAQGNTVAEYLACYQELRNIGDFPIAIGGMLRRRANTARYVALAKSDLLEAVLTKIRSQFDPDWLFVFGAYHPSRHTMLAELGVTGSDYKGWIFNYEHRRDMLSRVLSPIKAADVGLANDALTALLNRRESVMRQLHRLSKALRGKPEPTALALSKAKRKETIQLINRIDKNILAAMSQMPVDATVDRKGWNSALRVLKASDREIRFQGVHDYFEHRVLPNICADNGVTDTIGTVETIQELSDVDVPGGGY